MIICGGLCMVACGALNQIFPHMAVALQMLLSGFIITLLEFITGYIVNIQLNIGVWDYSYLPYNLMGQICLPYTLLWTFLSIVIIFVDDIIRHYLYNEDMPKYRFI
jgi:uncharacterized membrane protein